MEFLGAIWPRLRADFERGGVQLEIDHVRTRDLWRKLDAKQVDMLSQFFGRWYVLGYRGVLNVIAEIDSLTYGLNLLTAELLHGCLPTTERVADAALGGRLPGRNLRKIDLADDYPVLPE